MYCPESPTVNLSAGSRIGVGIPAPAGRISPTRLFRLAKVPPPGAGMPTAAGSSSDRMGQRRPA